MALITLLTDFGLTDTYVGVMKGVLATLAPHAVVVDLSHGVPAQNIEVGARMLADAVRFFPAGTIHVAVVDPGVGSKRRGIAVACKRGILVGPDNGLLWPAAQVLGLEHAVVLDNPAFHQPAVSSTFHGRDVFASVAGHLASGVPLTSLGSDAGAVVELSPSGPTLVDGALHGVVTHSDAFGNVLTNVPVDALQDTRWTVRVDGVLVAPLRSTFSDVPVGALVAYLGSSGVLEVAVRNGNLQRRHAVAAGAPVVVTRNP